MARGTVTVRTLKDGSKRYHTSLWVELADGSRKQIWKTFDKRKDADGYLDGKSKENREDGFFAPVKMTFGQFADEWFEKYPTRAQLKPSTFASYHWIVEKYLLPFFAQMQLAQIKAVTIEKDFRAQLPEHLSGKSVRNILLVLQRMLRSAAQWEYIRMSPFQIKDRISLPAKSKEEKGRALNPDEIHKLLDACSDDGYTVVALAILSGMRKGEVFGLKWEDVDFYSNQIAVKRAIYWKHGKVWGDDHGYAFVSPKSKAGVRRIDVTPKLRKILLEHRLRSKKSDLDLVFCSSEGTPVNPANFSRDFWRPALKAAGIGNVRFHDLRHTFGSIKLALGMNLYYVMKQMGHSSIAVTCDIYGHSMKECNPEAAQKTDDFLFGGAAHVSEAI
jgi:integrase